MYKEKIQKVKYMQKPFHRDLPTFPWQCVIITHAERHLAVIVRHWIMHSYLSLSERTRTRTSSDAVESGLGMPYKRNFIKDILVRIWMQLRPISGSFYMKFRTEVQCL